jgi:sporulation protein YunB
MRMSLENKRIIRLRRLIIVLIFFSLISLIFSALIRNIKDYFLEYATKEIEQISSIVINSSITDDLIDSLYFEDLYVITKNERLEIEMVDYNSFLVVRFLRDITNKLQNDLIDIENGNFSILRKESNFDKVLFYMPFGRIFNTTLFNNMGPKIPVKVEYIGYVSTNIKTVIKEYGINNSLIEMSVHIEINAKVLLPLISKDIVISRDVPISYKIINGSIPNYYGSSLDRNSSIYSIPLE